MTLAAPAPARLPLPVEDLDAVLFDIGSTLVDGPERSPYKTVAALLGLPGEAHRIGLALMTRPLQGAGDAVDAVRGLGLVLDGAACAGIEALWEAQRTAATARAGAVEALRFFRGRGKTVGVVSDIWPPYFEAFERVCSDAAAELDLVVTSFALGVRKPDLRLYRRALELAGSAPARTLMVGDSYDKDVRPAHELGLRTAWVLTHPEREVEALAAVLSGHAPPPTVAVAGLPDLLAWLGGAGGHAQDRAARAVGGVPAVRTEEGAP